jgi:hypothetical protein
MGMSDALAADRKATRPEVVAHAESLRETANRLSAVVSHVVGAYVHVITDDSPNRPRHNRCDRRGGPDCTGRDPRADPPSARDLMPADKSPWDGDLVLRLAVERLWISARKPCRRVPTGERPWRRAAGRAGRYRHRLAHALPVTSPAIGSGPTPPPISNHPHRVVPPSMNAHPPTRSMRHTGTCL